MAPSDAFRLVRSSVVCLAVGGAAACGTTATASAPRPGVAEMQSGAGPASFVFARPSGRFAWIEARRFDAAVSPKAGGDRDRATTGAERELADESQLRWEGASHASIDDTTVLDERLVHATLRQGGRTVVDGEPAPADVTLVVDAGGNLESIRGLGAASAAVRALAAPDEQERAARLVSPRALRDLVTARHDLFVGDVVGRPARPGSTWIVEPRPGDGALLRRYTVEGTQACGERVCSRLRVHVDLDPSSLATIAGSALGASPATLRLTEARYAIDGTVVVDPATLAPYAADLREAGRAVVSSPRGSFDLSVRASTQDRYRYAAPEARAWPTPSPVRTAAR